MSSNAQRWKRGKRRIEPGLYVDERQPGELHIDPEEFLTAKGYQPTPHNIAMVEQVLSEGFQGAAVHYVDEDV